MNPRSEALAFRIWQYAEPLGWDCTAGEIADALRVTPQAVGNICRARGWTNRTRKTETAGPHWCGGTEGILAGGVANEILAAIRASADEALS